MTLRSRYDAQILQCCGRVERGRNVKNQVFKYGYLKNEERFLEIVKRLLKQLLEIYHISKNNFRFQNPFKYICSSSKDLAIYLQYRWDTSLLLLPSQNSKLEVVAFPQLDFPTTRFSLKEQIT